VRQFDIGRQYTSHPVSGASVARSGPGIVRQSGGCDPLGVGSELDSATGVFAVLDLPANGWHDHGVEDQFAAEDGSRRFSPQTDFAISSGRDG
jgi:hypothetical protein